MPFWGRVAEATESPDGPLRGISPGQILQMLQAIGRHYNMRRTSRGVACSLSQRRILQRQFCAAFKVTEAQYDHLLDLFEYGLEENGPDAPVDYLSLPGEYPANLGRRSFSCDRVLCCGRQLKVRNINATVYERDVCYVAFHVVKTCVVGCGSIYYLNKRVVSGDVAGETRSWHVFYAWSRGQLPGYLASKSGKSVFAIAFLHYIAIQQCTLRYGDSETVKCNSNAVSMSDPSQPRIKTSVWRL